MPSCVVKGCRNYDTKVKKKHGISYHRFPNDPVRKEIWSRIIRNQRKEPFFKPHKNTRVCSAHFCDKDVDISKAGLRRLKGSAVPRLEIEICENKESRPSTPAQSSQVMDIDVDISDLNSIFDTPRKIKFKKRLVKLEKRQSITDKKIKKLQKQNARLKKRNKSLQHIIIELKQKSYITEQIESALQKKAEIRSYKDTSSTKCIVALTESTRFSSIL